MKAKLLEKSFSILLMQASILGQPQAVGVGAVGQEVDCTETNNGCTCEFSWMHSGLELKGCQNPDKDPNGAWCMVNIDSCKNEESIDLVKSQVIRDAEEKAGGMDRNWDRCKSSCELGSGFPGELDVCISGNQTLFGCSCKEEWTLTQDGLTKAVQFCENPDNDPGGNWCKIDDSLPCDFALLTDLDQIISNSETLELEDFWDYCITDCGGLVRQETLLSILTPISQAASSVTGNFGEDDITSGSSTALSAGLGTVSDTTPSTSVTQTTADASNDVIVSNPKISNEQDNVVPTPSSSGSQSSGGFFGGNR